jgi:hypothetical protein
VRTGNARNPKCGVISTITRRRTFRRTRWRFGSWPRPPASKWSQIGPTARGGTVQRLQILARGTRSATVSEIQGKQKSRVTRRSRLSNPSRKEVSQAIVGALGLVHDTVGFGTDVHPVLCRLYLLACSSYCTRGRRRRLRVEAHRLYRHGTAIARLPQSQPEGARPRTVAFMTSDHLWPALHSARQTDNRSGSSYDRPHPLVDLAIGRIVEEVSRSRSSGDGTWLGSSTRWQFFPIRGARVFPTTPKNIQKPTRDSSALRHPIESRNQWALVSGARRDR